MDYRLYRRSAGYEVSIEPAHVSADLRIIGEGSTPGEALDAALVEVEDLLRRLKQAREVVGHHAFPSGRGPALIRT